MKQLLVIALATGSLLASCKKSSSTSTTPGSTGTTGTTTTIPTDGWTIGGVKHKQAYCLRQDNQTLLNCVDGTTGTINSFAVIFHSYPTVSGTYHIVAIIADSTSTMPGAKIGANDIIVSGAVANGKDYWSTGVEHKDAKVTVTNGKIKVEVPEVAVATGTDTVKITGTMIEN